jgi:hypothetical protein
MTPRLNARVIYLVLYPHQPPVTKTPSPRGAQPPLNKNEAPYFLDLDIELLDVEHRTIEIDGLLIDQRRQIIDDEIVVIESAYPLADVLNPDAYLLKQATQAKLLDLIRQDSGYGGAFLEEYTIVCLSDVSASPDDFVQANRLALAALLRNVPRAVSEVEADQILASRTRYTDRDLTIVDWDGALLIDADEDFRSDIELLKIGNYELLGYRLLDRAIERNLEKVRHELQSKQRLGFFNNVVREALEQRLGLLLDFEKAEQSLLLIGDWYSSQFYRLIVDEFYIDDWKATVKGKLDQLESITDIIHENFTLSWQRMLDLIQLAGWLLLLVGYFVLFYFEVVATIK